MESPVLVVTSLPSRREVLVGAVRASGLRVQEPHGAVGGGAVLLDVTGLAPEEIERELRRLERIGPIVALSSGARVALSRVEEALRRGATDVAFNAHPEELGLRLRHAMKRRGEQTRELRHEASLVELAAATGETLEPTAVLRAILDWIGRAIPGAEPSVVLDQEDDGSGVRVVLPGPSGTLSVERASFARRPELRPLQAGARLVRIGGVSEERGSAEEREARDQLLREGFVDAVSVPLRDGDVSLGLLAVRAMRLLEDDEIKQIRAASALATRAIGNAKAYDASSRSRERLERAYADRYRELLDTNRKLRELSRQKDELLGICAHDLRQPLHALLAHARLMLAGSRGPLADSIREGLESISAQARRMSELIEDLLDLHALETGRLELKVKPVDLGLLAREVCDALEITADEKGVRLIRELPAAGPRIVGDASKLREVIGNLLGNAVKFAPPGSRVELQLQELPNGRVRLAVRDEGPGIESSMLRQILSGEGRRAGEHGRGKGRGLGIVIAREIIALHGGALDAVSEVGAGSTFRFELPRTGAATGAEPVEAATTKRLPLTTPPKPRVLVVEDDPDVRLLLVDLLEADHELITAGDGEEGVRLAKETLPDIVLMDLFLPKLDGFAALEALQRDSRTAEIPVLFLSAGRDDLARVHGLDRGAADFLAKPFSAPELRARIGKALRSARQQDQLRTLAQTDALTGLPNYRAFRARLEEEIKRARRYLTPLAAIMIDLDNLKEVNDTLGHDAGNRAIVALAEAVRAQLRETDFAARYGGDEFVILMPHSGAAEARVLGERLRDSLRRFELEGSDLALRASLGVASLPPGSDGGSETLLRAADAALYRAKGSGRDRVCIAGEEESTKEALSS